MTQPVPVSAHAGQREAERSAFARLADLLAGHEPGKPLISLSLGEPQHPVPDFVGPVLAKYTAEFGRYPIAKGIEPFRKAAAAWMGRRFKLPRPLDPESEVLALNGSREGLFFAAIAAERYVGPRRGKPAILFKVVDVIVGLRVTAEKEREGLDVTEHTERAYNM